MVKKIKCIVAYVPNDLEERLTKICEEMEKDKLCVEVQYSAYNGVYTALVLGREKVGNSSSKAIR